MCAQGYFAGFKCRFYDRLTDAKSSCWLEGADP